MFKARLSIKLKKRLSLLILLVGLPVYIILSITVLNLLDRPPIIVELGIYLILGILWALPFKYIFRGVGKDQE
tara:strand:- start:75 stop:293 length:219 start_codon:yes stop_codon:yes gene_type:complete